MSVSWRQVDPTVFAILHSRAGGKLATANDWLVFGIFRDLNFASRAAAGLADASKDAGILIASLHPASGCMVKQIVRAALSPRKMDNLSRVVVVDALRSNPVAAGYLEVAFGEEDWCLFCHGAEGYSARDPGRGEHRE